MARGVPARDMMAGLFGKATGSAKVSVDQCTFSIDPVISWEDGEL